MPLRSLVLIEAPTALGLRPPQPGRIPGTRKMPSALRSAGAWDGVPLRREMTLPEPPYRPEIDPVTGIRNLPELVRFTRALEQSISEALGAGCFPVVVGGDCSVLVAAAVSVKRRGRHGLVHVDGHSDFGHAGNFGRPYAAIAGADLAVVTGRGPDELTNFDQLRPYFRDEDVAQFGEKDDSASPDYWFKDFPQTAIQQFPLKRVRAMGFESALDAALTTASSWPVRGVWVHVDLDVVDSELLPAVDSPDGQGLDWRELEMLLDRCGHHPAVVGFDLTIFDPDLDPDGAHAAAIAGLLRRVFRRLAEDKHP